MGRVHVNEELCVGCGACVQACLFGAIELEEKARITEACRGCGSCVSVCPCEAIEEESRKASGKDLGSWRGVMVFAQQEGGRLHPVFYEILGKAKELAAKLKEPLYAAAIGSGVRDEEFAGLGLDRVYCYDDPCYEDFRGDVFGPALCACIEQVKPAIVLYGATMEARALAPYAAVRFHTGLTADCTELAITENGLLLQTRPAFGGNIMANILTEDERPQMATVREKVFRSLAREKSGFPEIIRCKAPETASEIDIYRRYPAENFTDIADSDIIVAVGKGVKRKEDLPMFQELADRLGAAFASSRARVELGWMPIERQIGLSGRTVKPKLLLTLGISGSIQFQAGMSSAERIIAVNRDPEAPIHSIAHVSVVEDIYEFVPALMERLKGQS